MKDCFVYLSGPITAKHGYTVEDNVAAATKVYWECIKSGVPAFCPHLGAAFPTAWTAVDYNVWLAFDFAVIARSSHVLMLERWETSEGARKELEYADRRGVPVVFSLAELHQALAAVDPHVADPGKPTPREAKSSSGNKTGRTALNDSTLRPPAA